MAQDKTLITTVDAAEIIQRTPERVRQLIKLGVFQTARLFSGRTWLLERWEVEKYAEDHPEDYRFVDR